MRRAAVRLSNTEVFVPLGQRGRPLGPLPSGLGYTKGCLHPPCVYFAFDPAAARVKIGTTRSLPRRFRQVELSVGRPLRLLLTLPGDERVERALHRRFASDRRARTEWFDASPALLTHINSSGGRTAHGAPCSELCAYVTGACCAEAA